MLRKFQPYLLIALCVGLTAVFTTVMAQESAGVQENPNAQDNPGVQEVLSTVSALRVTSTLERARLIVDLSVGASFAFVSLHNPNRIAVDVQATNFNGARSGQAAGEGLVSSYKVEQISTDRLRTMLILSQPAQVQQAYVLAAFDSQPARLIVDIISASEEEFAHRVETDKLASPNNVQVLNSLDQVSDQPGTSQILATSRPLILIDPGHGGIDGGAKTAGGVEEKTITLLFARQLQEILIASGRFDVALTRDDDTFFRLEDRVQVARQNKADLLISLHADSFEDDSIKGASVYIRDEQATDVLDKVLAENENKVDLLAGFVPPEGEEAAVVDILVDLMRREMRRQSFAVAQALVEQLRPSVRVRRFPLRRADFFVLQSPDVPAVLLELGFLSNSSDARNLTSLEWRQRAAEAVARGLVAHFDRAR